MSACFCKNSRYAAKKFLLLKGQSALNLLCKQCSTPKASIHYRDRPLKTYTRTKGEGVCQKGTFVYVCGRPIPFHDFTLFAVISLFTAGSPTQAEYYVKSWSGIGLVCGFTKSKKRTDFHLPTIRRKKAQLVTDFYKVWLTGICFENQLVRIS